ncbi:MULTISPECIES: DUF2567 domain-containing protein [unclassified Mycobacterium]|uniref:DUF2567 domain-containing protein n=1 Tax=unclassified Mycobacterium TaxID=2642494 RepID=UPI0007FCD0A0|nr:hypothetical protein A9X04_21455 [Mycobacterium sp. E3247]OBI12810.1 hypothetical protein A5713_03790 [Mycobacterium sp. E2497]
MTQPAETAPPATAPATSRTRAIAVAALGSLALGVLIGGLWAWIAPPIHAVVALTRAGERVHDYLGTESEHFFDAPCLMLGLLTVLAVVAPVLAWQWRVRRGPGMVVALAIGMVTVAAAATATGAALVRLRYGALDFDAVPLSKAPSVAYVIQAPPVFFAGHPLRVALTLLWPAAIAALLYAVFAAADARDDLGAYPPGGRSGDALPVGAGGAPDTPLS